MAEEVIGLRDVEVADLEELFRQQLDPVAVGRSKVPPRDRDAFLAHWTVNVLGDPTVLVQAVTVGGVLAGSIVSWWAEDRRYVGYWFAREFWGRGVGTEALGLFLRLETV